MKPILSNNEICEILEIEPGKILKKINDEQIKY